MEGPIKKILVYIDGSEESITAFQYAICLAKAYNAELYALYVVNTKAISDLLKSHIFIKEEKEEYTRDLEKDAERYLKYVKNLGKQKNIEVNVIKGGGLISHEIKDKIKENNIDLLILGELSRIISRRDEFFSETERAVRLVSCSVLIVKNQDKVIELFDSLT